MKYTLRYTGEFKRSLKRCLKRGYSQKNINRTFFTASLRAIGSATSLQTGFLSGIKTTGNLCC